MTSDMMSKLVKLSRQMEELTASLGIHSFLLLVDAGESVATLAGGCECSGCADRFATAAKMHANDARKVPQQDAAKRMN